MGQFRKKPVVIEAMHYDASSDSIQALIDWSDGAVRKGTGLLVLKIDTLEGTMDVTPGDWVIKGVANEFYACKPNIFEATYEPAGEA